MPRYSAQLTVAIAILISRENDICSAQSLRNLPVDTKLSAARRSLHLSFVRTKTVTYIEYFLQVRYLRDCINLVDSVRLAPVLHYYVEHYNH